MKVDSYLMLDSKNRFIRPCSIAALSYSPGAVSCDKCQTRRKGRAGCSRRQAVVRRRKRRSDGCCVPPNCRKHVARKTPQFGICLLGKNRTQGNLDSSPSDLFVNLGGIHLSPVGFTRRCQGFALPVYQPAGMFALVPYCGGFDEESVRR